MTAPTQIIYPPAWRGVLHGRRREKVYTCDDGKQYTIAGLEALFARLFENAPSAQGIRTRLSRYGWQAPEIFAPRTKRGYTFSGKSTCKSQSSAEFYVDKRTPGRATQEWRAMGIRPRNYRLARLRLGSWERQQLQEESNG